MVHIDHFSGLSAWLECRLGYDLRQAQAGGVAILSNTQADTEPLLAFKTGEQSVMRVRPEWVKSLQPVVDSLALDELFSVFGCYELARVTLADGVGVWGPSWYFFGDASCLVPTPDGGVVQLTEEEIAATDNLEVFWHCGWQGAATNFGVQDKGQVIALASVRNLGSPVFEIDVDVAPDSGKRGLGRAVMGAAGKWILDQGGLVLARTAAWNVPSARLLRSVGLKYVLCDLEGKPGPFRMPPQPLGKPLPDTELYNLYPDWAMNGDIHPRPSSIF